MAQLNLDDLNVTTFETDTIQKDLPYCCTGCDSGCGINPTAGGCQSGGGETWEFNCTNDANCWAAA